GINRACAYATRSAFAADDQAADAEQIEVRKERRSLEDRGALLGDDHVLRLRRELVVDAVFLDRLAWQLHRAPCRDRTYRPIVRPGLLRAIEHLQAGTADRSEQLLGRLDRAMRIHAATVRILRIEVDRPARAAAINSVVEVDRQERGIRTDKGFPCIRGIELEVVGGD